jgi:hypothetical protein
VPCSWLSFLPGGETPGATTAAPRDRDTRADRANPSGTSDGDVGSSGPDTGRQPLTLKLAEPTHAEQNRFSRLETAMPRLRRLAVFLIGAVLGLALWISPTLLSDEPLPWDSQGPVYAIILFLLGLLLGVLGPGETVAIVAGVFLGQLLVLLGRVVSNSATSDLWLVSAMLLAGYTVVATGLGALLGSGLRRRLGPVPRGDDRRSSS